MKKITKLTKDQEARLGEFRDRWLGIGLSTEPADRPRAERAIAQMYAIANLPAPKIVWCSSPIAMGLTRAVVLKVSSDPKVLKKIRASVGASVRDSVRASVWASVWASVRDSVCGQHEAAALGFYEFFSQVCSLTTQTAKLAGLWELAQSAGWALPHQGICWVSERHCIVKQDDQRRIHCVDGPAIKYPDGWAIYAVRGVRIPSEWIEDRKTLTPQLALTWKNVEQRRVACELLGWHHILTVLNAKTIDSDGDPEIGELVEVELPDSGRERFLRVRCGTGREFALPVPREMNTALRAQAWTWGLDEKTFIKPEIRT